MSANIEGKVVVITGGSSGIGEATARYLAKRGATVALAARRVERLEAIVKEIQAADGKAKAFQVDVTDKAQVDGLIAHTLAAFGRIDVLINNAGLMAIAPLAKVRADEWDRMIDINIKGVLYGISAALPVFMKQGFGHFINVASIAGLKVTSPGGTVYSATKFAVRAISEGLRHEVGGTIRTTIISPGAVTTELPAGSSDEQSAKAVAAWYQAQAIPADSIARAIAYAIEQPADVDVNEIVVRPTAQAT
jgi:NADP-dependent 3-hydroxy acid dehydrogenase YdfG